MRPARLELEGFASFRHRQALELADDELFVLTGPTGAGKSTLIDAITFALYGSVPRYEDRRLVAPVISQGMAEARVRLEFSVGEDWYTAVRVVKRTANGATTKEARLESRSGPVLAGNADELTKAVEQLVGLTFDHFVRCVVLPQGDFAEFMRARPKDRQDLLVGLLGLREYERIGELARRHSAVAQERVGHLSQRLAELSNATEEALRQADERISGLEATLTRIDEIRPQLDELDRSFEEHRRTIDRNTEQLRKLAGITVPDGVEELAARSTEAAELAARQEDDAERAREEADLADEAVKALPVETHLTTALDRHRQLSKLQFELEELKAGAANAGNETSSAHRAATEAVRAVEDAERDLERIRDAHAAVHLAMTLTPGEACPVCLQEVRELPHHDAPAELEAAEAELERRKREARRAAGVHEAAVKREGGARSRVETCERRIGEIAEHLADALPADEIEALIGRIREAKHEAEKARASASKAHRDARGARETANRLAGQVQQALSAFDRTRDDVAELGPPVPDRSDLAGAWRALVEWAARKRRDLETTIQAAQTELSDMDVRRDALRTEILEGCRACGVAIGPNQRPRDAVVAKLSDERARREQIVARIDERERLSAERSQAEERAAVATALGQHLNAKHFERWLLNRALERLVTGATHTLKELSSGAYSLALTQSNEFEVIDHRNADERRSAKTLSGGETFLASLSLALALSDHVAELAAGQTARLDALFLDEGFGTLDPETLDTVATAIEELGARGRMVGLVTHVRDLADRIPVRYEVRKVGGSSTVTRVTA